MKTLDGLWLKVNPIAFDLPDDNEAVAYFKDAGEAAPYA